jgi:CheY-like chemotaxis protein
LKKKVLIVNHTHAALIREKSLLNRDNFQVLTATSGDEALQTITREAVDAVIMDMNLPDMTGEQVCRKIKDSPDLKKAVVLITTISGTGEEELCRRSGADGCMRKPLDKDSLAEKLADLLGIPVRQVIRILCKVRLEAKAGSEFFIANTVDVSVTGLLFECEKDIKVGEILETSFFLPIGGEFKRVVARSSVMRSLPTEGKYKRYGVQYTEFLEGGPELIYEFVSAKAHKE